MWDLGCGFGRAECRVLAGVVPCLAGELDTYHWVSVSGMWPGGWTRLSWYAGVG